LFTHWFICLKISITYSAHRIRSVYAREASKEKKKDDIIDHFLHTMCNKGEKEEEEEEKKCSTQKKKIKEKKRHFSVWFSFSVVPFFFFFFSSQFPRICKCSRLNEQHCYSFMHRKRKKTSIILLENHQDRTTKTECR
jgi:hypothetical protein